MRSLVIASLLLSLVGCSLLGGQRSYDEVSIDTVRKSTLVANAEIRAANLLLQEVIRSGTIHKARAQEVKDRLQQAKDILQQTELAYQATGNPLAAEDELERLALILDGVMVILSPYLEMNTQQAATGDFMSPALAA